MDFYLMSKDRVVLKFQAVGGMDYNSIKTLEVYDKTLVPISLGVLSLAEWVERRCSIGYRFDIDKFIRYTGLDNVCDMILTTRCASLSDTFWVKSVGSKLMWKHVSLFGQTPDRLVSVYSMTGKLIGHKVSSSPEFATDGTFSKSWLYQGGKLRLLKAGTDGACNAGLEPLSEVYAYKIAKLAGIDKVLPYSLSYYSDTLISICDCMTSEETGMVQMKYAYPDIRKYKDFLFGVGEDVSDKSDKIDMLFVDYLSCNIDRHFGNISLILDNETNRTKGLSLIYDNNLSCLPYYIQDLDGDIGAYINGKCVADGSTWDELLELIDGEQFRLRLKTFVSNYKRIKLFDSFDDMLELVGCTDISSEIRDKVAKFGGIDAICPRDDVVNKMIEIQLKRAGA